MPHIIDIYIYWYDTIRHGTVWYAYPVDLLVHSVCWLVTKVGPRLIQMPLSLPVSSPPIPTRYQAGMAIWRRWEWRWWRWRWCWMFDRSTCHSGSDFWRSLEANELRQIRRRQMFTQTSRARMFMYLLHPWSILWDHLPLLSLDMVCFWQIKKKIEAR
jgi:hypothetical protein